LSDTAGAGLRAAPDDLGSLLKRSDIGLAVGVMAILVVLILPLPSLLLDFALAISITTVAPRRTNVHKFRLTASRSVIASPQSSVMCSRGILTMTVKAIHDFLEQHCPVGGAFAIESRIISQAVSEVIKSLAKPSDSNSNLPMDQAPPQLRFSFGFDAASFSLSTSFGLSIRLEVWLHARNRGSDPIVTVVYDITDALLEPLYDTATSEFHWISKSIKSIAMISEVWGTDQALIDAGYVKSDSSADKQKFLEEIWYGFKWVTARNLLPNIMRNIPFPQVQTWFLPFALQFPFKHQIQDGYLIIWTEFVQNVFENCGKSQAPADPPPPKWRLRAGSPAPSSPYDNTSPKFALYIAATNLVSWQAGALAPAVMLSGSGGGFIRWSYDVAVAIQSLMMDLIPAPNGGEIALHVDLRLAGQASDWNAAVSCNFNADGKRDRRRKSNGSIRSQVSPY
jgi:hypothetical protein